MSKVKVLPVEISNKIAAGEVVERPASVVKELLENAIDSGADKITVEIQNGGISYIRVTDNGIGMDEEDAKTAFLPHATSKISTEDDLYAISTLGFRGEALASIAAVSKVDLMTQAEGKEGVFVHLDSGVITECKPVGSPKGTTIVVKDLFYNTPARMKFLKKNSTEGGYIADIIERIVLANKDISVKFIADGKEKLFFAGDGDEKSSIYSVYGKEYTDNIIYFEKQCCNLKIHGFAGKSAIARGNRTRQSFFVNGRYIKSKSLTFWAEKAYENQIMIGKFPFLVVYIEIPYSEVDINVHPTKQEVKFVDEKTVTTELYWAIKNALAEDADKIRNEIKSNIASSYFVPVSPEKEDTEQTTFTITPVRRTDAAQLYTNPNILSESPKTPAFDPFIISEPEQKQEDFKIKNIKHYNYKIIGQLFNTYVIIELNDRIVLIDQHAAHERMLYEKLVEAEQNQSKIGQMLLSPIAVSLTAKEYSLWFEMQFMFEKLGFGIEDFGNNTVLVRQTPVDIATDEIKSVITEILDTDIKEYNENKKSMLLHTIACKAAVKGNDKLHDFEINALISELMETGGINTCPHGRPIMVEITRYELEKMFKRIQ